MRKWFLVALSIVASSSCGGDRPEEKDASAEPSCSLADCDAIRDLGSFSVFPMVTAAGAYQVMPGSGWHSPLLYRSFATGEEVVVVDDAFGPSVRIDQSGDAFYLVDASKPDSAAYGIFSDVRGSLHRFQPADGVSTALSDGVQAEQYDACGPFVWAVRGYLTGVNCGRHLLLDTRTGESLDLADSCDTQQMPQLGHFSPDCSSLVLGGFSIATFQAGGDSATTVARSSSTARYLVSDDGTSVAAWSSTDGGLVQIAAATGSVTPVADKDAWPLAAAPGAGDLLYAFEGGLHLHDAATGSSTPVDDNGGVAAIASTDGRLFAWVQAKQGESGPLRVLDRSSDSVTEVAGDAYNFDLHWQLRPWEQAARPLAFTDDGRFLVFATASGDSLGVRAWNRETGDTFEIEELAVEEPPSYVGFVIGVPNPNFILDTERNRLAWLDATGRLYVHALDDGRLPAQVDVDVRFFRFAGDSLFWIDRDWHGLIVALD